MSTSTRVAGFVVAIVAVFGAAALVGRVVGPVDTDEPEAAAHDDMSGEMSGEMSGGHGGHDATPTGTDIPGGLMVSQDGYTLALRDDRAAAGTRTVRFEITGPDGEPVTAYDVEHEKRLHLIAVRRDQTGFQHVHPTMDDHGLWSVDLTLTPGDWRLFADFKATGADPLTLGADLVVAGGYQPRPPGGEVRTATVDDYQVTLAGDLAAGQDAELTLTVRKDGRPVTDLQPYLGAYGHLVALRSGDLAYLHVHPDGQPGDGRTEPGPTVVFYAAVPSDGTYHLYLDFRHGGVVRTAAFTVTAGAVQPGAEHEEESGDGHGH